MYIIYILDLYLLGTGDQCPLCLQSCRPSGICIPTGHLHPLHRESLGRPGAECPASPGLACPHRTLQEIPLGSSHFVKEPENGRKQLGSQNKEIGSTINKKCNKYLVSTVFNLYIGIKVEGQGSSTHFYTQV